MSYTIWFSLIVCAPLMWVYWRLFTLRQTHNIFQRQAQPQQRHAILYVRVCIITVHTNMRANKHRLVYKLTTHVHWRHNNIVKVVYNMMQRSYLIHNQGISKAASAAAQRCYSTGYRSQTKQMSWNKASNLKLAMGQSDEYR